MVLLCLAYPLALTGIARLSPGGGRGETVEADGRTVGFEKLGQSFTSDRYFWGRPSAVGYNAAGSGGSTKGPSDPGYLEEVRARIDTFMVHNPGVARHQIPVELVTASGSGLDPHITPEAAAVQVKRIAGIRHLPEADLQLLVASHTEPPLWGVFGPRKINVLKLNVALDRLK